MGSKREEGYYWVTVFEARRILQYYGGEWWITSNCRRADEEDLTDINENRIVEEAIEKRLTEQL